MHADATPCFHPAAARAARPLASDVREDASDRRWVLLAACRDAVGVLDEIAESLAQAAVWLTTPDAEAEADWARRLGQSESRLRARQRALEAQLAPGRGAGPSGHADLEFEVAALLLDADALLEVARTTCAPAMRRAQRAIRLAMAARLETRELAGGLAPRATPVEEPAPAVWF